MTRLRCATTLIFIFFFSQLVPASDGFDWQTRPEKTNYRETSSYSEVLEWIGKSALTSPNIHLSSLTTSVEGRSIPLLIIGPEGVYDPAAMRLRGLSSVLVMANIHAGEVEGKEACLMVLRDMVKAMPKEWIKDQVILMIPIFNPDGNEKLNPKNRGDNGPDEAGTRHNGQFLDLNRDYIKLDSPEVNGLISLFHQWDPILFLDMHTTNGSYHQHPVTWATAANPNGDPTLSAYMWEKLFPAMSKRLKDHYGHEGIPYGNFGDRQNPGDGDWVNDTCEARYGTNYYGLWNRFTILDENYSHADFKTRVSGAYGLLRSVLDYTAIHIREMTRLAHEADLRTVSLTGTESFVIDWSVEKLFEFSLKSYEFIKEAIKPEDRDKYPPWIRDFIIKKTDVLKNYRVAYMAKAVPKNERPLPQGYILLPHRSEALRRIKAHGIRYFILCEEARADVEIFKMSKVKIAERLYQGLTPVTVEGRYERVTDQILPEGSIYIPLNQRLRRLIPVLMEPDQPDSLVSWGIFSRELVGQWSNQPQSIPVFRLPEPARFRMALPGEVTPQSFWQER